MAEVLRDVAAGGAKPIYNYLNDMPDLAGAVRPILPSEVVLRAATEYSSFETVVVPVMLTCPMRRTPSFSSTWEPTTFRKVFYR
jgi:hypothetical protein